MPRTPPTTPPSRRTLTLIVVPIVVILVGGTIANAIHPQLLKHHPLLLIALEPRNRYLILTAQRIEFVPFLMVAVLRRLASDPLFYLLGFLYGENAVRWIERQFGEGGAWVRGFERAFARAAPVMVFLFPGALICVLAGATGMSLVWFAVLNVVGTVTAVTVLYEFADVSWVAGPIDAINGFYSRNNKWLTIVSITLVAVWLVGQRKRGRLEKQSMSEIEAELKEPPQGPPLPRQ